MNFDDTNTTFKIFSGGARTSNSWGKTDNKNKERTRSLSHEERDATEEALMERVRSVAVDASALCCCGTSSTTQYTRGQPDFLTRTRVFSLVAKLYTVKVGIR